MKEYNEQVVETLDDAGCIIANKNIIIDNFQARIAELEAENERLRDAVRQQESQVLREQATSLDIYQQLAKAEQLWQLAQGRCDGLEEKLAKAEQRVAEACADFYLDDLNNGVPFIAKLEAQTQWQPISTVPKDGAWIVVTSTHNKYYRACVQFCYGHWYDTQEVTHDDLMENAATHWMPMLKAPADGASS